MSATNGTELLQAVHLQVDSKYRVGLERLEERLHAHMNRETELMRAADTEGLDAEIAKRRATEKNYAQMLSERFHETEKFAKEWKLTRGFD